AFQHAPEITREQRGPADDVGRTAHLVNRPEQLPERMPAEHVILLSELVTDRRRAVLRGTHRTMMKTAPFRKRPRLPPLHPRHQHGSHVNAAALQWPISADRLEAFLAKHLARTGNVFDAAEPEIIRSPALRERHAADAELRILREAFHDDLEDVGF